MKHEIQNIQDIEFEGNAKCKFGYKFSKEPVLCKTSAGEEPKIIVALKGQH
jgi:hypothetical protein